MTEAKQKADDFPLSARLQPDQPHLIARVRALRLEATELRRVISIGSYGDKECSRLYKIANDASMALYVSNPELAKRAGLGDNFFSTLVRDRRRPKLANFLRALTAIIEVADERLHDVDRALASHTEMPADVKIGQRIQQDHAEILRLAQSLARMALDEIDKLDAERPNEPDRFSNYMKQRELLQIFADGFAKIAASLSELGISRQPRKLMKATKVVESVGEGVNRWWLKNQDEAIDWSVRIPFLTAGVAALGWAGANMTVGTTVIAALVGGGKVFDVVSKRARRSGKK